MRSTTTKPITRGVLSGLLLATQACYSYVPVDSQASAPVGQVVELQITDRGRVGLGERLGPGIREIAGKVVGDRDSGIVLSINRVTTISGMGNTWSGDTAHIGRDYIGGMTLRRISVVRSASLAVAAAAAVYLMSTKALVGSGSEDDGETEPPPILSNRIPIVGFRFSLP